MAHRGVLYQRLDEGALRSELSRIFRIRPQDEPPPPRFRRAAGRGEPEGRGLIRTRSAPVATLMPDATRITSGTLLKLLDCDRRLWLSERGRAKSGVRTEHDDMLGGRSRSLEDRVAALLPDLAGPMLGPRVAFDEAARETVRLLRETRRPIRRPVLISSDGRKSATPAFLLREGEALVVRDVRLSHRPERQRVNRVRVSFAAWLAHELTGFPVARLEIVNGLGELVTVQPEPDEELAALTEHAMALLDSAEEPGTLLGHSHCQHCDHYDHCWDRAEAEHRVEVVPAVNRARAALLHAEGSARTTSSPNAPPIGSGITTCAVPRP